MIGDGQGKRPWVYYANSKGPFRSRHRWIGAIQLLILMIPPWIMINGNPLLLMDIPDRRLYLLGTLFTAP